MPLFKCWAVGTIINTQALIQSYSVLMRLIETCAKWPEKHHITMFRSWRLEFWLGVKIFGWDWRMKIFFQYKFLFRKFLFSTNIWLRLNNENFFSPLDTLQMYKNTLTLFPVVFIHSIKVKLLEAYSTIIPLHSKLCKVQFRSHLVHPRSRNCLLKQRHAGMHRPFWFSINTNNVAYVQSQAPQRGKGLGTARRLQTKIASLSSRRCCDIMCKGSICAS